jgi:hypothetical protein
MGGLAEFIASTLSPSISMRLTEWPSSAKQAAETRPTYPPPTIEIIAYRPSFQNIKGFSENNIFSKSYSEVEYRLLFEMSEDRKAMSVSSLQLSSLLIDYIIR